jgi:hypothetical protein
MLAGDLVVGNRHPERVYRGSNFGVSGFSNSAASDRPFSEKDIREARSHFRLG